MEPGSCWICEEPLNEEGIVFTEPDWSYTICLRCGNRTKATPK
jgi:hypothetical protein